MNPFDDIDLVTLDLDGTLWDVWPTIARAEERLHAWLHEHFPRVAEDHTRISLRQVNADAARSDPSIAHDVTALRLGGLRLAALRAGYSDAEAETAAVGGFEQFIAERNRVELFPGAAELLAALSGRFPLVALSNGNADVDEVGIGEHFAFAINAREAGTRKPHPAMFELACARAEVPAARTLHIGDEFGSDILGAQAAGVASLWYNPTRESPPRPVEGMTTVSALNEILAFLEPR
ncbi:MAG: HAD family hydrolase [Gammaproteobacteria bacterium]